MNINKMITIVDYGLGNLGSILNMLKKIGVKAQISGQVQDIEKADKIILPGVGAFDNGMHELKERGLIEVLNWKALEQKTPTLGICLGMQLLGKSSEEGTLQGLGWIDAHTHKFSFENMNTALKIPHMGWNLATPLKESKLMAEMYDQPRFYFVHSYFFKCKNQEDVLLDSNYGLHFTSGVERENIMGVQFHPEKSHKFGMKLLSNFADI